MRSNQSTRERGEGGMTGSYKLAGARAVIPYDDERFPDILRSIPKPPSSLYVVGNVDALKPGLAVIGARRATPYGRSCAKRFARLASERGIPIISGGARGCDLQLP